MKRIRVIPVLLIQGGKLVKTVGFAKPTYIGDPINSAKIFNDKEADELIVLDISASRNRTPPNFELLVQLASECFMPLCYGGGIRTLDHAKKLFASGIEKIALNTITYESPKLIEEIATIYGSQAVVASIDVDKTFWGGYQIYTQGKDKKINEKLESWVKKLENYGAGEIMINAIHQDGTMQGYDLKLVQLVAQATTLPVVACGGAGKIEDFRMAISQGKASAVAAGSMFVFNGKHRAVLISYPSQKVLTEQLYMKIS
jgi:cyclase